MVFTIYLWLGLLLADAATAETTMSSTNVVDVGTDKVATISSSPTSETSVTDLNRTDSSRITATTSSSCSRTVSLVEFTLQHPGFPGPYANNELCRYVVQRAANAICGVELTFRRFDLEMSPGCNDDFLAVGDERLCGEIPANSVVEYPFGQSHIVLVFGTNNHTTRSGFQLNVKQILDCQNDLNAIPAVHACDVLITDAAGEVVTHRTSDNDPVCRYTLGRRHSGFCQVELDFVDFNVDFSPNCVDSYVELEGHRFCGTALRGQRKNVTFDVLGNVHIVYRTETVRRDRGFHLIFRQLPCLGPIRSPGGVDLVGDRIPSACNKIVYDKEFYLESPSFPSYYENNLECQYVIRRFRDTICKLEIRFLDFDVEASPGCQYDFLEIDRDRLCGRIPEDQIRTTDFLTYEKIIRFKTDAVNPRPGFFLYVRQVDCTSTGSAIPESPIPGVGSPIPRPGSPIPRPGSPIPGPGSPIPPPGPQIPSPGSPNQGSSYCDQHMWDREGRLTSPNYPSPYGNNLNCRYTVHRQGDHICHLRVTFLDFRVQNGGGCYNDYLEIDGWKTCGDSATGSTKTFDFRLPEKVILFHSDPWITGPGFVLSVHQLPCGSTSARLTETCDREVEAVRFELQSDGHPAPYAPSLHCRYVIRRVADTICQLQLRFITFDLEPSVSCSHDYLAVDGERLCGTLLPNTTRILRFDSPEKTFIFHSDARVSGSGFLLQALQVDCPGGRPQTVAPALEGVREPMSPCDRHFTEIRSTFTSPGYPSPYPNYASCRYVVHVQPGYCQVEFIFPNFQLEVSPGACTRDYLEMGGARFCGRQLEGATRVEPPYGSSKEVVLRLVTNDIISDKGFVVTYRQLPCGTSPSTSRGAGTSPPYSPASCSKSYSGHMFDIRGPDLGSADYGQTLECVYTVHRLGPDTCRLRVTFISFDMGTGHECPRQYMQIGEHTLCGRQPAYTVREYEFRDYVLIMRLMSSQLPRPRVHLQVQQLPCEISRGYPPSTSRLPPPMCDQTIYQAVFELRSPYYPHAYPYSVDCRYIVQRAGPDICHLELTFERFALATSQHCYYSHVRVDSDRICGSLVPFTVRMYDFTSPEKIVHFRADHVAAGTGFLIRGRQVPCGGGGGGAYPPTDSTWSRPAVPGLPSRVESDVSSMRCDQSYGLETFTMYSPNHPHFYPNNAVCRYVIIRSSSDVCGLEVTFLTFDLEDYYQCQRDYLDIDGERLCGVLTPNSVRRYNFHPADRTKLLVFRSDHSTARPGFVTRVQQLRSCHGSWIAGSSPQPQVIHPSSSCGSYSSTEQGFFTSPGFPRGYAPGLHCLFNIVQLPGFCSVYLNFQEFELTPSADCRWDYLELEGRRYCDRQLARTTRVLNFPWAQSSTSTIVFHSDQGSYLRGFHVEYRQLPCRQGRWQREQIELQVTDNSTSRAATTSSQDEAWDDTQPQQDAIANSTLQSTAK